MIYPSVNWYPFGGCWILPEDRKIYPKKKLISIIASEKRETEGHKLRHEIIDAIRKDPVVSKYVDVFGRGYNPVDYKLEALKDYRFSIVIENEKTPFWFTEKLIDCFMTGTVPIYWGITPIKGCITFFNTADLIRKLQSWIFELGWKKNLILPLVSDFQFNNALQFTCPEDWLYENFFMKQNDLREILIKQELL